MEELIIVFEAVRDNALTNVDLFSNKYCLGYKELKKLCITSLEKVIGENNIKLHWSGDYAEFSTILYFKVLRFKGELSSEFGHLPVSTLSLSE